MENKRKLIIDFDGCLVNTIEKIVSLYQDDFHMYRDYKKIHWTEISSWEFSELSLISRKHINDYFDQYRFFQNLNFMENALEVVTELSKTFEIVVCSMGRVDNLKYKNIWLKENLPCMSEFIGVDMDLHRDKSLINMSDAFAFIDDSVDNLITCNCKGKRIIYGEEYIWNKNSDFKRCYNWTEVMKYLEE